MTHPKKRKPSSSKKTPVRRRKTVRRKKGMLSELFNPNMAQAGGKIVLAGAIGGVGASLVNKMLPDTMTSKTKALWTLGSSFVTATVLKMPNVGAGMAGVAMFNLAQASGFLAEDADYANDLDALPIVLSEDQAMQLSQDGQMYLSENGMYLADEGIYPNYDYASFGIDI